MHLIMFGFCSVRPGPFYFSNRWCSDSGSTQIVFRSWRRLLYPSALKTRTAEAKGAARSPATLGGTSNAPARVQPQRSVWKHESREGAASYTFAVRSLIMLRFD